MKVPMPGTDYGAILEFCLPSKYSLNTGFTEPVTGKNHTFCHLRPAGVSYGISENNDIKGPFESELRQDKHRSDTADCIISLPQTRYQSQSAHLGCAVFTAKRFSDIPQNHMPTLGAA